MMYLYETYLAHHGVKGMQWGKHNMAGKNVQKDRITGSENSNSKKPENVKSYKENAIRKTLGGDFGQGAFHKMAMNRQEKKIAKAEAKGDTKKADAWRSKNEAYKKAEANQQAYRARTSTAKLIAQNALLPLGMAAGYRHARARGSSRITAILESTGYGAGLRLRNDRDVYGHYTLHSGI